MLNDKKELTSQCEAMVAQLKEAEKKFAVRLKAVKEGHAIELKRQKDISSGSERARREKWVTEQTKKIKEMTIKGLEPEIERLVAAHKEDMHRLHELHQAELDALRNEKQQDADEFVVVAIYIVFFFFFLKKKKN